MGCWFATKDSDEVPGVDERFGWEIAQKIGNFDNYSKFINKYLGLYYDKFITHFISAFAGEIIPMLQMASLSSVQHKYLLTGQSLFDQLKTIRNYEPKGDSLESLLFDIPHYALAVDAYPLLNWANLVREKLPQTDALNVFLSSKRKLASVEDAMYIGTLLKRFEESDGGYKTFIKEICSPPFKEMLEKMDFFDREMRITCDIPMKNLFVELFYGLYGFPYLANTEKNLALKYKAKETTMYSNVFVFDQCRYLYDFLPTPDLWESFFKNFANQTIIRGCIDGIRRNHIYLNSALFKWGFIEGISEKFMIADLDARKELL
jgi:hypothetical protein